MYCFDHTCTLSDVYIHEDAQFGTTNQNTVPMGSIRSTLWAPDNGCNQKHPINSTKVCTALSKGPPVASGTKITDHVMKTIGANRKTNHGEKMSSTIGWAPCPNQPNQRNTRTHLYDLISVRVKAQQDRNRNAQTHYQANTLAT